METLWLAQKVQVWKKLFRAQKVFPVHVSMASRKETFRYPKSFFGRPRPCSSKEAFGSHVPTMSHRATLACPLLWTGAKHRSCLQVLRPQLCRRFLAKGTKVILWERAADSQKKDSLPVVAEHCEVTVGRNARRIDAAKQSAPVRRRMPACFSGMARLRCLSERRSWRGAKRCMRPIHFWWSLSAEKAARVKRESEPLCVAGLRAQKSLSRFNEARQNVTRTN